jgi:hypothetical protein
MSQLPYVLKSENKNQEASLEETEGLIGELFDRLLARQA